MRQTRKDSPTTARSVGFRACGVKHTRLLVDSLLDIDDDENEKEEEEAATISAQRRRKRRELRAAIRKRNDDVTERANSDSEILQLPKAAQQAEEARRLKKMSEENNNSNNSTASLSSSSHSSVDTLQWSEDKIFGRNASPEELLEALGMFCTICIDYRKDAATTTKNKAIGRPALCTRRQEC